MQSDRESPQFVQTSLAGALSLGLEPGRFMPEIRCTCLNLLLTYVGGCRAACSYCGLAHNSRAEQSKTFIRVKWPAYPLTEILERVRSGRHPFKRACVSMITHGHALEDACTIIRRLRESVGLPVSGLLAPTVMEGKNDLQKIRSAGADRVGIAIDAATEELFARHRGAGVGGPHRWDLFWQCVADSVEVFGRYKAGIHLIAGLGETEEQMVHAIAKAYRMGAMTHLFSFFPEGGSILQNSAQPPLGKYRRIQLARYLINEGITDIHNETFAQLENRIPEARIGDFSGHPAPAAERQQRRLFEREARVSSLQQSEKAQGRKMSSARSDQDFQGFNNILFSDEGQIIDFGLDIEPYLQKGEAFMTSGCPDQEGRVACNRPFGNERASEPMRNYPFPPGPEDIRRILPQIWDDE